MPSLIPPPDRVLSTLNADGSRRWLRPVPSRGRFMTRRRAVAYLLIAIFVCLPYIRINDKPAMLLDLVHREFTFFGKTFLPTDTLLLALLLVSVFLTIFFMTALLGRVWCGWACPQTVYLEFVYRPIERLFEGTPGRLNKRNPALKPLKLLVYLIVSMLLAHIFLAYFVGVDELAQWVRQSPFRHPAPFLVMAVTTALVMFDFGFFREQVCIVACPYGRMQSVMLDRSSLIVTYDRARGEPRGPLRKSVSLPVVGAPGDCVDCDRCVATCPTGIDIRDGLQMECIGCAQCIDACDDVMARLKRPAGLIRYSSQAAVEGAPRRIIRPRVVIYSVVLLAVISAFVAFLITAAPVDVRIMRGRGLPFNTLGNGSIANQIQVKLTNRTVRQALYELRIVSPASAHLVLDENPIAVDPGQMRTEGGLITLDRAAFDALGICDVTLVLSEGSSYQRQIIYRALGPAAHHDSEPHPRPDHPKENQG